MFPKKVDAEVRENAPEKAEKDERHSERIEIKSESIEEITTNALDCFGWKETKTERWLIKAAKIWYAIMSLLWFLTGCVTFAPVIFIGKKVEVIFKGKKRSLVAGIVIYALCLSVIVGVIIMRNIK